MRRRSYAGAIGAIVIAAILFIGLIVGIMCTTRVPAGYVAVQYKMNGGIMDEILSQGWHIVSPTIKTSLYTIGIEQSYLTSGKKGDSPNDESFTASSKEGKAIDVDLTFTYQYDSENVTKVFTQFKGQSGTEVRDSFIKPNIVSWTKEVIARYAVADILGAKRADINIDLTNYLASKFAPYHILISNVSLIDLRVDEQTQEAINNKIRVQQQQESQAIENQTAVDKATAEATVARTRAQAEADARLIAAQAEADALTITAKAEAEANRLITESLTDNIIRNNTISQWDGKLPSVFGANGNTLFDVSNYIPSVN